MAKDSQTKPTAFPGKSLQNEKKNGLHAQIQWRELRDTMVGQI